MKVLIIHDYNGPGRWEAAAIDERYRRHARRFGLSPLRDVEPSIHEEAGRRWVRPAMERIIEGIEAGDLACAQIGIEFIEEDRGFPFGAILKANTARALRRFEGLTDGQIERIRSRIVGMILTGVVPREYREYSKLLRKVGFADHWHRIIAVTPQNRHAARALAYFVDHCAPGDTEDS